MPLNVLATASQMIEALGTILPTHGLYYCVGSIVPTASIIWDGLLSSSHSPSTGFHLSGTLLQVYLLDSTLIKSETHPRCCRVPEECPEEIAGLLESCLQYDAALRPRAPDIVSLLRTHLGASRQDVNVDSLDDFTTLLASHASWFNPRKEGACPPNGSTDGFGVPSAFSREGGGQMMGSFGPPSPFCKEGGEQSMGSFGPPSPFAKENGGQTLGSFGAPPSPFSKGDGEQRMGSFAAPASPFVSQ